MNNKQKPFPVWPDMDKPKQQPQPPLIPLWNPPAQPRSAQPPRVEQCLCGQVIPRLEYCPKGVHAARWVDYPVPCPLHKDRTGMNYPRPCC
jgi:hypothetical protein